MNQLAAIAARLALLVLGTDRVVKGAVAGARALGRSEMVMGLTAVAVGASLPELVTSSAPTPVTASHWSRVTGVWPRS